MSIEQMVKVWSCDVPAAQQSILMVLADHARHDGARVFPSVARISWASGLSRRTVQRELGTLVDVGALRVEVPGGGRMPTQYSLHLDLLPQKQPFRIDPRHGDAGIGEISPSNPRRGDAGRSAKASQDPRHGDAGQEATGVMVTPQQRHGDAAPAPQLCHPTRAIAMAPYPSYNHHRSEEAAGRATPAGAPTAKQQAELQQLMERRQPIGIGDFRDPEPGESVEAYRKAQDAEWNSRQPRDRFAGAKVTR